LVGGIEYLANHPDMDAAALSQKWLNGGYRRLGGGTYCQYIDKEDLYLINGFYPRLLEHFTKPGACIACFVVRGATPWKKARSEFAGATAPEEAVPGSIRNGLLTRKKEFGLPEVSPNLNGVHLSAGPLEGVVEIMRFSARHRELEDLVFGKMLIENFDGPDIDSMLSNSIVAARHGSTSCFDLTEELDSNDAIDELALAVARK
jgi:nucleoside diphosphate kinase